MILLHTSALSAVVVRLWGEEISRGRGHFTSKLREETGTNNAFCDFKRLLMLPPYLSSVHEEDERKKSYGEGRPRGVGEDDDYGNGQVSRIRVMRG